MKATAPGRRPMRALLSWSSGKDCAYALDVVRRAGEVEVVGALTTVTGPFGRVSMHGVREDVLRAQLAAAGLPARIVHIPYPCPNDVYEARMGRAMAQAKADGVTHVVFGDLFLADVRAYRERMLAATGIAPLFPLWGRATAALAREMVARGIEATVVAVDLAKLPASFAGRRFNAAFLADLPDGVDPCGENGEFHTCVTAGPMLRGRLPLAVGGIETRDGFAFCDLTLA